MPVQTLSRADRQERFDIHPALFDHIIEGADDLFHRGLNDVLRSSVFFVTCEKLTGVIGAMCEYHINVLEVETLQRLLGTFDDASMRLIHRS